MVRTPVFGIVAFAAVFFAGEMEAQGASQSLDTVRVHSKSQIVRSAANPTKYDLFLERKAQGNGFFMMRADIESHVTTRIQSLFSNIPGIKVRQSGTAWTIQSQRCGASTIKSSTIRMSRSNAPGEMDEENLGPLVYIDGQQVGGTASLDLLRAGDIEAIEVYQGASQVPAEAKGRACFAIFLWTRNP